MMTIRELAMNRNEAAAAFWMNIKIGDEFQICEEKIMGYVRAQCTEVEESATFKVKRIKTLRKNGSEIFVYDLAGLSQPVFLVVLDGGVGECRLMFESNMYKNRQEAIKESRWLFNGDEKDVIDFKFSQNMFQIVDSKRVDYVAVGRRESFTYTEIPESEFSTGSATLAKWHTYNKSVFPELMCFEFDFFNQYDFPNPDGGFLMVMEGLPIGAHLLIKL